MDSVQKLEKSTGRLSSKGSDDWFLQQLKQLIQSEDWINGEVQNHGESSKPSEFPKKWLF